MDIITPIAMAAGLGWASGLRLYAVVFFTGGAFTPRAKAFLEAVPNARIDKPPAPQNIRALIRERLQ